VKCRLSVPVLCSKKRPRPDSNRDSELSREVSYPLNDAVMLVELVGVKPTGARSQI
jgi:hypothetical protein